MSKLTLSLLVCLFSLSVPPRLVAGGPKLALEIGRTETTEDGTYRTPLRATANSAFGPATAIFECPFRLKPLALNTKGEGQFVAENGDGVIALCGQNGSKDYSTVLVWANDAHQICADLDATKQIEGDLSIAKHGNIDPRSILLLGLQGDRLSFRYSGAVIADSFFFSADFDRRDPQNWSTQNRNF